MEYSTELPTEEGRYWCILSGGQGKRFKVKISKRPTTRELVCTLAARSALGESYRLKDSLFENSSWKKIESK